MLERTSVPIDPVVSSNLAYVGYVDERKDLFVKFKNGALWVYHGVPAEEWTGLMAAESKGSYFARNIKKWYPGEPVPGENAPKAA